MTDKAALHALGFTAEQAYWLQGLEARIARLEHQAAVRVSALDAFPSLKPFRMDDGSFAFGLDDVQEMDAQQLSDILEINGEKPGVDTPLRLLKQRMRQMLERMTEQAKEAKRTKRRK